MNMTEYDEILKDMCTSPIARQVIEANYGKPLDDIYYKIQYEEMKHTSTTWFPGDIVLLYPNIKELKANKIHSSVSDSLIHKGSYYINYSGLLIDYTTKSKYVLGKPLKFELGDITPYTIGELEALEYNKGIDISLKKIKR
jgi:hypothetical protein